jgi:hypothetical protein
MRIITIIIYVLIIIVTLFILLNPFDIITKDWLEPESPETDTIQKKLYNPNWNGYRLGDVYYLPYINAYNDLNYHITQYPGSIASQYMSRCNGRSKDMTLLTSIVSSFNGSTGNNIELIIHIRIGDIMCDILSKDNRKCYSALGNYEWWESLINNIKKYNIKTIAIIAGAFLFKCLDISACYLLNRKKYIENNTDATVELALGKSPDEDLIFANKAKYFISTGGGYGKLISELITYNGGVVLYTTSCNNPKFFINVTSIVILIIFTILILLIN